MERRDAGLQMSPSFQNSAVPEPAAGFVSVTSLYAEAESWYKSPPFFALNYWRAASTIRGTLCNLRLRT